GEAFSAGGMQVQTRDTTRTSGPHYGQRQRRGIRFCGSRFCGDSFRIHSSCVHSFSGERFCGSSYSCDHRPDRGSSRVGIGWGRVEAGDFKGAGAAISAALADASLDHTQRTALEFQRERMRRILMDFSLDEAAGKARLRRDIPDMTDEEFARWDAANLVEARVIDGERRWFSRGPSNLFRLSEEARQRRATPLTFYDSPLETAHPHHAEVRDAALASGHSS